MLEEKEPHHHHYPMCMIGIDDMSCGGGSLSPHIVLA